MIYLNNYNIPSDSKRVYSTPENRHKHRWKKNYAGFSDFQRNIVGKCPNDITLEQAQNLLEEAITDPPDEFNTDPYPKRLYNVYKGVIYLAIGDGRSNRYHAFPADNIKSMDKETLRILEERAIASGDENSFKKWVEDNATRRSKL